MDFEWLSGLWGGFNASSGWLGGYNASSDWSSMPAGAGNSSGNSSMEVPTTYNFHPSCYPGNHSIPNPFTLVYWGTTPGENATLADINGRDYLPEADILAGHGDPIAVEALDVANHIYSFMVVALPFASCLLCRSTFNPWVVGPAAAVADRIREDISGKPAKPAKKEGDKEPEPAKPSIDEWRWWGQCAVNHLVPLATAVATARANLYPSLTPAKHFLRPIITQMLLARGVLVSSFQSRVGISGWINNYLNPPTGGATTLQTAWMKGSNLFDNAWQYLQDAIQGKAALPSAEQAALNAGTFATDLGARALFAARRVAGAVLFTYGGVCHQVATAPLPERLPTSTDMLETVTSLPQLAAENPGTAAATATGVAALLFCCCCRRGSGFKDVKADATVQASATAGVRAGT